jgi:hypothetical protein
MVLAITSCVCPIHAWCNLKSYLHVYYFRAIINFYNIKNNNNINELINQKPISLLFLLLSLPQSFIKVLKITSN